MTKINDRSECVIIFREEDGSSRDVELAAETFERLLMAWKLFELERGEPASFDRFIAHAAERVVSDRRTKVK